MPPGFVTSVEKVVNLRAYALRKHMPVDMAITQLMKVMAQMFLGEIGF
jgi:hypothetical protein